MLPVAILAGGLATRLRPVTRRLPKALIEVAGEPFILHQLRYLRDQGIAEVVLCIGYLGEQIEALVGDGSQFGLRVRYSPDGPVLLGTGGALRQALPMLGDEWFVLYGDSYLPVAFRPIQEAFRVSGQPALMTVLRNRDQWDRSNVLFERGMINAYSKNPPPEGAQFIDYGLSILSRGLFAQQEAGARFDLTDLFGRLVRERRLAGYEVDQRFYEIGSFDGLEQAEAYLLERGQR